MKTLAMLAGLALLALSGCDDPAASGGGGSARSELRIVGSSTVFPFAKRVAEQFVQAEPGRASPVLESTGTGGGIELFCAGVGLATPDIVNASRRMKPSEFEKCAANGVTDIVEIPVGIDGIAIAEATGGPAMKLTSQQLYEAIAANPYGQPNTARTWADVDPSLPAIPISVYGPPATSGTRDALKELVLMAGCDRNPAMAALKESDEEKHEAVCTEVRSDGAYIETGENDNLIIQKLTVNKNSIGIFGYSFLEENSDQIKALSLDGSMPSETTIADRSYPAARTLYIYVKKAHVGQVPGLAEFVQAFAAAGAPRGPLSQIGLIPLPEEARTAAASAAQSMPALTAAELN